MLLSLFVLFTRYCQKIEFYTTVIHASGKANCKTGLIYHLLHKKMPVPSQKYDSCYPFI